MLLSRFCLRTNSYGYYTLAYSSENAQHRRPLEISQHCVVLYWIPAKTDDEDVQKPTGGGESGSEREKEKERQHRKTHGPQDIKKGIMKKAQIERKQIVKHRKQTYKV